MKPLLQPGVGEGDAAVWRPVVGVEPVDLQAPEVVCRALPLALARERHHRAVARSVQLLELGLGLLEAPGLQIGRLGPELERLVLVDARQADVCALVQRLVDGVRVDVQLARVAVAEGGADVLPVVGERGRDVLLAGDHDRRVLRGQRQERMEVLDREELGDVRPVVLLLERCDLRQFPVLLGQLRRGLDLDHLSVAERALCERREPAQRLDLVAEQIDPHRAVLGGGEHVEQPAADRELAAVLDLVDALVAGGDEIERRLVEIEQVALFEHESMGPERRVRDLLRQRHRADDDHGRALGCRLFDQCVERGDPETHEVRGRSQVRLVRDAAARVVAHDARFEPGLQAGREIARGAVVAGDDDRRRAGIAVEQRREHVRTQRLRDERAAPLLGKLGDLGIVVGVSQERAKHLLTSLGRRLVTWT